MHPLAQRVLSHMRRDELLHAGDRVGVAVSGGIDSVALLRLLLELRGELGIVLSVVHFNHKLRGEESDADERFVADLARAHNLEFYGDSDDVGQRAVEERISVETAARELRYGFFRHLLGSEGGASEQVKVPTLSLQSAQGQGWGTRSADGVGSVRCSLYKIVTGHTLDDQAETVLMRLIRGAGLRGLGGIYPRIPVEDDEGEFCGEIVRPLLATLRRDLEQYLHDLGQPWREDATNDDAKFTRNRVRKLVVPLLEKEFNPAVAENLSELADIARGEEDYWENEVAGWMGTAVRWSEPEWVRASSKQLSLAQTSLVQIAGSTPDSRAENARESGHPADADLHAKTLQEKIDSSPCLVMNASVNRMWFLGEPIAVQRRLVKAIGDQAGIFLEFKHVEQILRFAEEANASGKELSLPLGWKLQSEPEELLFLTPDLREPAPPQNNDYEYELSIPGAVIVNELGSSIEARRVSAGSDAGYNPEHPLNPDSLPGPLRVRNWRAGDRFWPAHTKSPKKIKELLQERHIGLPERKLWPVVVSGNEIVWMRGFPSPAKFLAKPGGDAVVIAESFLASERST